MSERFLPSRVAQPRSSVLLVILHTSAAFDADTPFTRRWAHTHPTLDPVDLPTRPFSGTSSRRGSDRRMRGPFMVPTCSTRVRIPCLCVRVS